MEPPLFESFNGISFKKAEALAAVYRLTHLHVFYGLGSLLPFA
jgi:hypothetical protein